MKKALCFNHLFSLPSRGIYPPRQSARTNLCTVSIVGVHNNNYLPLRI
jgi:hypothetical protein